jgi:RIO kinase 1
LNDDYDTPRGSLRRQKNRKKHGAPAVHVPRTESAPNPEPIDGLTINPLLSSSLVEPDQMIQKSRSKHAVLDEKAQHTSLQELGADQAFNPSLGSSRHEREWIFTYLGQLYNTEFITDVLRRIKGGKEANVYVCAAHASTGQDYLAAKLYRPRMLRNLRNDSRYRANRNILDEFGKVVHDHGVLHAVRKGSSYGKEITHNSWLKHEYQTLHLLYDAGLPVPEPFISIENTILMEYIGDLDQPAPNLTETTLSHKEALRVRNLLIETIEQMLRMGRIHADLSAYNVLYWDRRPVIIDFPQAVNPNENPEAREIFERDVVRICDHFKRYQLGLNGRKLAQEIWDRIQPAPDPTLLLELLEMEQESDED